MFKKNFYNLNQIDNSTDPLISAKKVEVLNRLGLTNDHLDWIKSLTDTSRPLLTYTEWVDLLRSEDDEDEEIQQKTELLDCLAKFVPNSSKRDQWLICPPYSKVTSINDSVCTTID